MPRGLAYLRPDLVPAFRFAYVTGWRIHGEVLSLPWRQVDFRACTLRLDAEKTKNREGRLFKLKPGGELDALLRSQETYTLNVQRERQMVCPWVFHRSVHRSVHRSGKPIKNFYRAWRTACLKAGLGYKTKDGRTIAARIVHDLRRTAVRNLVRAGVPEGVAMTMTGHLTRPSSSATTSRVNATLIEPRTSSKLGLRRSGRGWHAGTIRAQSPRSELRTGPRRPASS